MGAKEGVGDGGDRTCRAHHHRRVGSADIRGKDERGVPVTASAVADMLAACGEMDVRSTDGFKEAIREPMGPEGRTRLRDAMRLARALGCLPSSATALTGDAFPAHAF